MQDCTASIPSCMPAHQ